MPVREHGDDIYIARRETKNVRQKYIFIWKWCQDDQLFSISWICSNCSTDYLNGEQKIIYVLTIFYKHCDMKRWRERAMFEMVSHWVTSPPNLADLNGYKMFESWFKVSEIPKSSMKKIYFSCQNSYFFITSKVVTEKTPLINP